MGKIIDLQGRRFERLTVKQYVGINKDHKASWLCVCDCGNSVVVSGKSLTSGNTKSCGCLRSERCSDLKRKHGKKGTRLYVVWKTMKQRCYNTNHIHYKYYGGRGIKICDEWRDDFQAFYDWAMTNGYDDEAMYGKCTIDRINNDGDYCPSNCRWVDMATQNRNKRNVGFIRRGYERI